VKTLGDFTNLASQIAKVTPSGVKMNDFQPTNTAAAACPSIGKDWEADGKTLPPVANADLCTCMMDTLSCKVKDTVKEEDYGDIFGFICGLKSGAYCAGIEKNATTGSYGAYGMCKPSEQLGFVLDQYSRNVTGGCDFKGQAEVASSKTAGGSCGTLLAQAGPQGQGTVTAAATGGAAQTGKGSPGAGAAVTVPSFNVGLFSLGLYILGAAASGMAMILL
jgi:1,3-beta-glucanosyltransferase GAS1